MPSAPPSISVDETPTPCVVEEHEDPVDDEIAYDGDEIRPTGWPKIEQEPGPDQELPRTHLFEVPMRQVMARSHVRDWRRASAAELTSILKNNTFIFVDRSKQGKVVGSRTSRIVLWNKFTPDAIIEEELVWYLRDLASSPAFIFRRHLLR